MSPEMIKLNCPSCGGQLELPNNLEIAFCTFCGTKVVLNTTEKAREQQKIEHYCELRDIAVKANNQKEVIEYCNRILEFNPSDVDSWIAKAVAVCNLEGETKDIWQEAIEYLRKAKGLGVNEERIGQIYNDLSRKQAQKYFELSRQKLFEARSMIMQGLNASLEYKQAMEYYLKAFECEPDNIKYLEALESLMQAGSGQGIQWGADVYEWVRIRDYIRAKNEAASKLLKLNNELRQENENLDKLKKGKGLFLERKIKNTEDTIEQIKNTIAHWEKYNRYEPPRKQL